MFVASLLATVVGAVVILLLIPELITFNISSLVAAVKNKQNCKCLYPSMSECFIITQIKTRKKVLWYSFWGKMVA